MSSAERIALKRLKRRRIIARRVKAYGFPFNHATVFGKVRRPKPKPVTYKIEHKRPEGAIKRFINKFTNVWK